METAYVNSFISSSKSYLEKLQFLGKNSSSDLRVLKLYEILIYLYKSANWFGFKAEDKRKLETFITEFILHNSNIILPAVESFTDYVNVNTLQNDYTWDRLWDYSQSTTVYDLDYLMYPDEMTDREL